jgi:hypothetical protein
MAVFTAGLAYEPEAVKVDNFQAILNSILVVENDTVSLDKLVLVLAPNVNSIIAFQNGEQLLEKDVMRQGNAV